MRIMLKKILIAVIIFTIGFPNVCAAAEAKSNKVKLKYEVTINDISSGIVKVKMNVSNLSGKSFEVSESWGNGLGYNSYIETIKVSDKKGKKLSFTTKQSDNGNNGREKSWNISLNGNKEIVIEYERNKNVFRKMHNMNTVWGFVGEDYTALSGSIIFITPANDSIVDPNIEVKFNVPKDAKVLVPWEQIGDTYYPNMGRTVISKITNSKEYRNNAFGTQENTLAIKLDAIGIGNYRSYVRNIGGIEVTVGVTSDVPEAEALKMVSDIEKITNYMIELFGASLDKKYLALFYRKPIDADDIRCIESTYSQGSMMRKHEINYQDYTHILFHRWNGWIYGWAHKYRPGYVWRPGQNPYTNYEIGHLVEEGFTEYYIVKSFIELHSQLNYNDLSMYRVLENRYNDYKNIPVKDRLIYNHATNDIFDSRHPFFSYDVGSLLVLYLDYSIMEATNGKKSLDDVQKLIWQRFSPYKKVMDKNDLLSILKEVSGVDYTEFYNKYINSNEPLNLDEVFADNDNDGVPNYIELIQNTDKNAAASYNQFTKKALTTIKFDDAIYEGQIVNGMPHGYGKITNNNWTYEGMWENGVPKGKGRIVFVSGEIMECEWNDWWKPVGTVKRENQWWVYEGTWSEDMSKHDSPVKGKMTYKQGGYYEGEFKDWKRHGYGKMVHADGHVQEGRWENDVYKGKY